MDLHHRTAIILGGPSSTHQSLIQTLTSQGADVVLLGPEAHRLQKFCQSISDQREVNSKYGRAGAIQLEGTSREQIKDGIGRASQMFGGLDLFIDGMQENGPTPFRIGEVVNDFEPIVERNLLTSLRATEFVVGFFKSRKKGRIIYLMNDSFNRQISVDAIATVARTGLIAFSRTLARQVQEFSVTVNCVSLGLTEEYLTGHFPDSTSIKQSAELMKSLDSNFRLIEADKVSQAILFLAGPSGASITGQHLTLN
jgi:NAD(P)-dependent dehydrogenase (short-subunit alcohol dehydrogenase family)